jgi:serine/threonine-protein kinase RsbW
MAEKQIKLTIDSSLKNVFLVGLAVHKICSYLGFNELESYQLELCVVEAVNNVIIHSYGKEAGHEVEVHFKLYSDMLAIDVCNTGKTMERDLLEKRNLSSLQFDPDDLGSIPEGGMGMGFINEIVDSTDYKTGGGKNCLTMTKKLPLKS